MKKQEIQQKLETARVLLMEVYAVVEDKDSAEADKLEDVLAELELAAAHFS
jgi:5-bromo-4-chloroindolyl phosphate hydrolysis protein